MQGSFPKEPLIRRPVFFYCGAEGAGRRMVLGHRCRRDDGRSVPSAASGRGASHVQALSSANSVIHPTWR